MVQYEIMTEVNMKPPADPIGDMRSLIRSIHQNGYNDLDAMQQFIILYETHAPEDDRETFFESLDSPDIGFEFWEGTIDEVVVAHDRHGGSRAAISFPETDHIPSSDWSEELETLGAIFESEEVQHVQSHALYVRKHAKELEQADTSGTQYRALLAKSSFLIGLAKVYDFEQSQSAEHIPDSWPDPDDDFLKSVLEAVGYSYVRNYQSNWRCVIKDDDIEDYITENIVPNLQAIAALEMARSGATQYLSEQYGIRHFSRYPIDLLVAQFDSGGRVDRPYGVIISAVSDHNGAFSGNQIPDPSTPRILYTQVKGTHDLLIAEAETAAEFEQRLQHFDRLNGQQYKIDFGLIETHGSSSSITFGRAPEIGSLALRTKLHDVQNLFSARASVVMTGCSTGQVNGIAQSLSRQFNTIVVAPAGSVGTEHITFVPDPESVRLIPSFKGGSDRQPTIPVVYKNGSPLGLRRTAAYLDIQ
jgi:hypothetical protein